MRGGVRTGTGRIAEASRGLLVRLMSGRDLLPDRVPASPASDRTLLSIHALPFGRRGSRLTLAVDEGEIVGLYGLVGAGRSSLLKLVWGAGPQAGGAIAIDGKPMRPGDIRARIAAGGAYLPEDRRAEGLVSTRSIADNLALADWTVLRRWAALPITSRRRLSDNAGRIRAALAIRMASPWALPLTLSGGNQQKLLFGRWFGRPIRLLLLDEPTRGVDVGAKAEIHAIVRRLASIGAAVLMVTSDIDELLALASRVHVFAAGELTATLAGHDMAPGRIVAAAFGHSDAGETAA